MTNCSRFTQAMRLFLGAGLLGILTALATPTHAQVSSPFVPTTVSQIGQSRIRNSSVQLFPLAQFNGNDTCNHISDSTYGGILALETGGVIGGGRRSYKYGGFLFSNGDASLYELHGKYYLTPQWGVQVGLLTASGDSGVDVDGFLLYNITPKRTTRLWSLQLGAGTYYINNVQAYRFTGFLQGSYEIAQNVTVDSSYWYINTPTGYFNRIVLGLGYRF